MDLEIVIADTSPLIGLSRIGRLALLPKLSQKIIVPPAVISEISAAGISSPGASDLIRQPWITVGLPDVTRLPDFLPLLGRGEAEALVIAQATPNSTLLLDDLRARKVARKLSIQVVGTVGLLSIAKTKGLINKIKPELDELLANQIFIHRKLIDAALSEAGE